MSSIKCGGMWQLTGITTVKLNAEKAKPNPSQILLIVTYPDKHFHNCYEYRENQGVVWSYKKPDGKDA